MCPAVDMPLAHIRYTGAGTGKFDSAASGKAFAGFILYSLIFLSHKSNKESEGREYGSEDCSIM